MVRTYSLLFIVSTLCLAGCAQDSSSSPEQNSPNTEPVNMAPEDRILAKWTVNNEATRKGWGKRASKLEKMMVNEMGMSIEFKEGNVATLTKGERTGDGYWEIKDSSAESLELIVASSKDAEKKVQVRITFQGNDQFLYQSNEMEFGEDLIYQRVTE